MQEFLKQPFDTGFGRSTRGRSSFDCGSLPPPLPLSPVHTGDYIVADFWRQFVAEFDDSRRFWRQSPISATVAGFGGLGVDRLLKLRAPGIP